VSAGRWFYATISVLIVCGMAILLPFILGAGSTPWN
jgi:hypothetical protein